MRFVTDVPDYERGRGDEFDDVVAKLEDVLSTSHASYHDAVRLLLRVVKSRDHRRSGGWTHVRDDRPMSRDWAAGYDDAKKEIGVSGPSTPCLGRCGKMMLQAGSCVDCVESARQSDRAHQLRMAAQVCEEFAAEQTWSEKTTGEEAGRACDRNAAASECSRRILLLITDTKGM